MATDDGTPAARADTAAVTERSVTAPGPNLFADDPAKAGQVLMEPHADGAVVLRISGALDLVLSPMLRQVAERAARQRPRLAVLDLCDVKFLASIGMAELLRAQALFRDHDTATRVVAVDRVVLRPLMVTRLIDEFDIHPSLEQALTDR